MQKSDAHNRNRWPISLQAKVVFIFALPILLIAGLILFTSYLGGKKALEEQARMDAIQTSAIILASMKHTMIMNDHTMMQSILSGASQEGNLQRVWIIDSSGTVQLSTLPDEVGLKLSTQSSGCVECHRYPVESRPQAIRIPGDTGTVRVVTSIANDTECTGCHADTGTHLGVLLTDSSIDNLENQLGRQLQQNLLLTLGLTILGMLLTITIINLLITRRVKVMQQAMQTFEDGDYTVRIRQDWRTEDEITRLADTFNQMADSIALQKEEQNKITHIRQQAMIDERERIARELHDGVSQFLGYLNTKLQAIRMLLEKNEQTAAESQIDQISQAVLEQSADVRASIIGLKLAERSGEELSASLKEYIRQYNRLAELQVDLIIEPPAETIRLEPEIQLHLVRIVQEAISNIRKHARAKTATVKLNKIQDILIVSIQDDGLGFNPWEWNVDRPPHFGLQSMRERAELVGAEFSLVSVPGKGTTVTIQLRLEEL